MTAPLRLLMIEDSADDAKLVEFELRRAGFDLTTRRVDSAASLQEALERSEWDLVTCDFSLPGFASPVALETVRRHDPDLPIILISGTIGEDAAVDAMKAGARDFLAKGRLKRLGTAVRREVRQAADRRRRRLAEEELARERERFDLLLQATRDVLYDWDPTADTVWFSGAIREVYGYPPGTVPSARRRRLELIHPEDRGRIETSIDEALAGAADRWVAEYRFLKSDGTCAWILDRARILPGPSGRPARWIGSMVDITGPKAIEERLQQAQRVEAMGLLAGGIAHDFNNLLMVIGGYAELSLASLPAEHPGRRPLADLLAAVDSGASLTRQLLTFSRREVVQPVIVDLNLLVVESARMLRRTIGENILLEEQLEPGLRHVRVDRSQMEQLLVNLAINARDAMAQGGRLTIRTAAAGSPEAPLVLLEVIDTGCGMDPQTLPRIFEPFFTTKQSAAGTGLGLAVVEEVVQRAGGRIEVESARGLAQLPQLGPLKK